MRVPSRDIATEAIPKEFPWKVRKSSPVAASQSLMVLSMLPERTRLPSHENATDLTAAE